jgi:hypothetical protein
MNKNDATKLISVLMDLHKSVNFSDFAHKLLCHLPLNNGKFLRIQIDTVEEFEEVRVREPKHAVEANVVESANPVKLSSKHSESCRRLYCDKEVKARGLCAKHYNRWYVGNKKRTATIKQNKKKQKRKQQKVVNTLDNVKEFPKILLPPIKNPNIICEKQGCEKPVYRPIMNFATGKPEPRCREHYFGNVQVAQVSQKQS